MNIDPAFKVKDRLGFARDAFAPTYVSCSRSVCWTLDSIWSETLHFIHFMACCRNLGIRVHQSKLKCLINLFKVHVQSFSRVQQNHQNIPIMVLRVANVIDYHRIDSCFVADVLHTDSLGECWGICQFGDCYSITSNPMQWTEIPSIVLPQLWVGRASIGGSVSTPCNHWHSGEATKQTITLQKISQLDWWNLGW